MRIDSAERFAYSFMFSNTQFCTISLPIITFRMKKVDSLFLVRLHWRIQNSSCTLNMPMFKLNSSSLTDSLLYTCQLSRLRRESHACGLKTSISRRLTPDWKMWVVAVLLETISKNMLTQTHVRSENHV